MIQVGAAQAQRAGPSMVTALTARRARPVAQGGDDDQVGGGARALREPALGLRQLTPTTPSVSGGRPRWRRRRCG